MSPDQTPTPEDHRGRRARVRNGAEQRNPSSSTRPDHQPVIRRDENSSEHPMSSLTRDQGVHIPSFDQGSSNLGEQLHVPLTQDQISYQQLFQQLFSGLDLVSPLVYGATKYCNCSKFFDKFRVKKKGEQSDPTPSELQREPLPEWSRRDYQEIVERYWQFVEEKFATSPHLKPRPSDPYDVEC